MKKNILILIVCLFLVGVFATTYNIELVGADSGFDSSYGGSSSSSSSHSSGSSGGRYHESAETAESLSIPYVFWGIFGLVLSVDKLKNKKGNKNNSMKFLIFYILSMIFIIILEYIFIENLIRFLFVFFGENMAVLPFAIVIIKYSFVSDKKPNKVVVQGIDNDKFIKESFNNYKELQIAWMNFDYDKIKELVSDEMYNMYTNQLETLKIKKQKNVMDDIKFMEGYITDYKKINNKEIFKIFLSVSCYDYIINTKNNMTVRGNKNKKLILNYVLTFERNIQVVKDCPKCGAPINNLTECEYCKSKIINNTSQMKMTKKEIKKYLSII